MVALSWWSPLRDMLCVGEYSGQRLIKAIWKMVRPEAVSTFAFQGQRWLADVALELLPADLAADVARENCRRPAASDRNGDSAASALHVWLADGPTYARRGRILLASGRRRVGDLIGLAVNFTRGADVLHRYDELLAGRLPDVPAITAPAQAAFAF